MTDYMYGIINLTYSMSIFRIKNKTKKKDRGGHRAVSPHP